MTIETRSVTESFPLELNTILSASIYTKIFISIVKITR